MMNIEIDENEARMLWSACNSAQQGSMHNLATLTAKLDEVLPQKWVDETLSEFEILQQVKNKVDFWKKEDKAI